MLGCDFAWFYLGANYDIMWTAERQLGAAKRINLAADIRQMTEQLGPTYVHLTSSLCIRRNNDLHLALPFLARYILAEKESAFFQWVLLEVCLKITRDLSADRNVIAVSDNADLLHVLDGRLNRSKVEHRCYFRYAPPARWLIIARYLLQCCRHVRFSIYKKFVLRRLRHAADVLRSRDPGVVRGQHVQLR